MKFEIFNFEKVTSTNDVAINLIKEKKKKNGFVWAIEQTQGRGTHGKKWISLKGNLFVTIFFQLKKDYPPFNEFSIINPVILSEVIGNFCKNKKVNLKFPNDVFINGKKVCGILQEVVSSNDIKFLVVGIGINVVKNPNIDENYKSTNMLYETKKETTINEIIDLLLLSYDNFFSNLNLYSYSKFKKKADSMVLI